ncbi:cytosine deaminase protein-like protein [Stemphylium lycopersici]|nr:cytosine deaminase protein [Stemphylium lycopersici]RAR02490.1 cytosine deaminase protein-like protein [Stemphylium lycopersici]
MQIQELGKPLTRIANVRIPDKPSSSLWDIAIKDGKIASVSAHDKASPNQSETTLDGNNRLLVPSLCHAHIHLDKCYLLQDPKFSDLQIESGDFQEAMQMTGEAKSRFQEEDLLRRGTRLIEESIQHGVTSMRAFVEVDGVVHLKCLHAGLKLKEIFEDRCDVQICAFAQLPLFSGQDDGAQVRKLMETASTYEKVGVLGSTPYVEDNESKSKENVRWITQLALKQHKHLDLHLDYFLEEDKQPLVWDTLNLIKELGWSTKGGSKQITLGHCTRLTRFRNDEWTHLRQEVGDLPVSFVGLPTSDLFMMRTPENVRGTLPIVELINEHGFNAAIAINNVGNAFTPYGNCDPLSVASLGVVYDQNQQSDQLAIAAPGLNNIMDPSGNREPHAPVPKSPTEQGVEQNMAATSEQEQMYSPHQPYTMDHVVHTFLNNVKRRFGQDSFEVTSIWTALNEFRLGRQSKKDTFVAMNIALSNHGDLKQDLMNVLFHQEADWGPGDFDFESPRSIQLPNPQFLEPDYQLQRRLPPVSWGKDRQAYPLNSSERNQPWSPVTKSPVPGSRQSFADNRSTLSGSFYESNTPQARSQETVGSSHASPSVLGLPVAVPLGRLVDSIPPPPKRRRLGGPQSEAAQEEVEREGHETAGQELVPVTTIVQTPDLRPKGKEKAEQSQAKSGSGPYIHSLCGKGFSSRSKVKKHHWGYVLEDRETTTGCWAKHGKPDVSWNEHPTCKEGATVPKKVRKTPRVRPKKGSLQQKAPLAPSMVPTLQDPPQAVASTSGLPEDYQNILQNTGFYYSHRLPNRSSFDSLLTAVNVASQIDAPRPQGRIDSAVSLLDAQAAAAERNRQYITDWQNASGDHNEEAFAHGYQHPFTTHGLGARYSLGGYHVPLEVALHSHSGAWAHTPSMPSPTEGNWVDDGAFAFDDARGSRACIQPHFFSEPGTRD